MVLKARRALLALLFFLWAFQLVASQQNNPSPPSSPPPSSSSSSLQRSDAGSTPTSRPHGSDDRGSDATSSFDLSSSSSSSVTDDSPESSATESPSATSDSLSESPVSSSSSSDATATGGPMDDPKFINATIPAGQLPLAPEITPGWGVAGVIMLTTGITYTLVGIKNRWIHTFFSTAYITALGVAVLIIYVMNVPVSHAMQGGYVVAVVMSGCAVGAASMFFKELTEGLGCALGGFCVSMWLLCLVPGGLLRSVPAKAIFNASFTLVGFALYFSRWTRDWALIVTLAFSGATATILGLDCFSRAGLKEFWAYVWDVNGNLFPLGADTYPVTKGIRVETAAIIIICIVGIISQIKLWRIVRDKRARRATERAEGQRNLELEEENVGRQVEEANARERRQWEQVYGNDTVVGTESRMSDLADTVSEKKRHHHHHQHPSSVDVVDISESDQSRGANNPLMAAGDAEEGKVMVRVGADDMPENHPSSSGAEKRLSVRSAASKRASQAPEVVPLPFNVPRDDQDTDSHRSSIATYAADDVEGATTTTKHRSRPSLAKRLSRGSIDLLKGRVSTDDHGPEGGESSDRLVIPKSRRHHHHDEDHDDDGSLAATVDGESASGDGGGDDDDNNNNHNNTAACRSTGIAAELPGDEVQPEGDQPSSALSAARRTSDGSKKKQRMVSPSANAAAGPSTTRKGGDYPAVPPSDHAKSIASVYSTSVSLTKDRLPRRISRVAMSYRTNEWAKHLGYAETPDPEELHLVNNKNNIDDNTIHHQAAEPSPTSSTTPSSSSVVAKTDNEPSVPVNVVELQKTAEDGTPAPIMMRSESRASDTSYVPSISRRASRQGGTSPSFMSPEKDLPSPIRSPGSVVTGASPLRRTSSKFQERPVAPAAEPIPEEDALSPPPRSVSGPLSLEALQRTSLTVPGVVSYNSPQTLIGQREMFLRSKSHGSLLGGGADAMLYSPPTGDAGGGGGSIYGASPMMPPSPSPIMGVSHDADDIPLSQRKDLMRHSSSVGGNLPPSNSNYSLGGIMPSESTENLSFNSHQPKRTSLTPTPAVREAQLANFRQSVQQDLRSATPIMTNSASSSSLAAAAAAGPGRESVFTPVSPFHQRETEVQRNIEMQRNVLMGQKEAEAQRKEVHRREKEFADRAFDERMRSGDLLEAHREAMRKMQKGARD